MLTRNKYLARQMVYWWEDQHPLTRNNVIMVGLAWVVWGFLKLASWLAPRFLSLYDVFRVDLVEQLWTLTSLILIAIMVFNSLRLFQRFRKRMVAWPVFVVALGCILGMILATLTIPSFFKAAVSYRMEQRYGRVFAAYQELCDEWEATYGQQATVAIRVQDVDLGIFEDNSAVNVYRERQVVFFDFGDDQQHFGLACVLGGGVPHTTGRATDFKYHHVDKNYYQFVEETRPQ